MLFLLCAVGVWSWLARPWEGWASPSADATAKRGVVIDRFDRVLDEYVSLGSYTALHRMNTEYTAQTAMLIEDVLQMGSAMEPDIEKRLRYVYLDSTMQLLLDEVHRQYADLNDIEDALDKTFKRISRKDPSFHRPHVYAQIGNLGPSIVGNDSLVGICLDKYLGADCPLYDGVLSDEQRVHTNRQDIVSDVVGFLHKE